MNKKNNTYGHVIPVNCFYAFPDWEGPKRNIARKIDQNIIDEWGARQRAFHSSMELQRKMKPTPIVKDKSNKHHPGNIEIDWDLGWGER